jgi:hypothetical protein
MKQYQGSCHCGAVRFTVDVDLSQGTMRCNCSFCRKIRCWAVEVAPGAFQLIDGQAALSEYRFGAGRERHYFCRHCGVRPFGIGVSRQSGDYYGVSVACLDGVSDEELAGLPIRYIDGRDDCWDVPPAESRYL